MMREFWNERYKNEAFAYGKQPNLFFKEELGKLATGKVLLPAEGEGRNAIYAALQGWDVNAFDNSDEGKKKALQLAKESDVNITYDLLDVAEFTSTEKFDCVALVFAHFPRDIQIELFLKIKNLLNVGGKIIVEAYTVEQMKNKTGGPQSENVMYFLEDLQNEFSDFEIELAKNETIELQEGLYHNGVSDVVRFVAQKI